MPRCPLVKRPVLGSGSKQTPLGAAPKTATGVHTSASRLRLHLRLRLRLRLRRRSTRLAAKKGRSDPSAQVVLTTSLVVQHSPQPQSAPLYLVLTLQSLTAINQLPLGVTLSRGPNTKLDCITSFPLCGSRLSLISIDSSPLIHHGQCRSCCLHYHSIPSLGRCPHLPGPHLPGRDRQTQ